MVAWILFTKHGVTCDHVEALREFFDVGDELVVAIAVEIIYFVVNFSHPIEATAVVEVHGRHPVGAKVAVDRHCCACRLLQSLVRSLRAELVTANDGVHVVGYATWTQERVETLDGESGSAVEFHIIACVGSNWAGESGQKPQGREFRAVGIHIVVCSNSLTLRYLIQYIGKYRKCQEGSRSRLCKMNVFANSKKDCDRVSDSERSGRNCCVSSWRQKL